MIIIYSPTAASISQLNGSRGSSAVSERQPRGHVREHIGQHCVGGNLKRGVRTATGKQGAELYRVGHAHRVHSSVSVSIAAAAN